jgi:hypothetical protein
MSLTLLLLMIIEFDIVAADDHTVWPCCCWWSYRSSVWRWTPHLIATRPATYSKYSSKFIWPFGYKRRAEINFNTLL